ncbi:hypothetical protein H0H92_006345 [Tricholoma furcatifolium]|nr:hypothetical protein H0H92_006345 [Tricholoma furcatifolium]
MYIPGSTFDLLFLNRWREHDARASMSSFIARNPAPLLDVPPVGGAIQVAAPQVGGTTLPASLGPVGGGSGAQNVSSSMTQQGFEPVQASPPDDAIMAEPMDTDNSVPAGSSEINVSPSEVLLPPLPEPSAFDARVYATACPLQSQRCAVETEGPLEASVHLGSGTPRTGTLPAWAQIHV